MEIFVGGGARSWVEASRKKLDGSWVEASLKKLAAIWVSLHRRRRPSSPPSFAVCSDLSFAPPSSPSSSTPGPGEMLRSGTGRSLPKSTRERESTREGERERRENERVKVKKKVFF